VSSPLPHPVVAISPTASTIVIVGILAIVAIVGVVIHDAIIDRMKEGRGLAQNKK